MTLDTLQTLPMSSTDASADVRAVLGYCRASGL